MSYIHDIAALYEGYRGQSVDFGPNVRYSVADAGPSATDKQPLPTATPGGGQYSPVNIGYNTGVPSIGGENEEEKFKPIKTEKLVELIDTEIAKARMYGMDYAVMVLSEIRLKLKKGL